LNYNTLQGNLNPKYGEGVSSNEPKPTFLQIFSLFFTCKHGLLVVCTLTTASGGGRATKVQVEADDDDADETNFGGRRSRTGELKNPGRSIPFGTIAACCITFMVYLVFMILISASTPRELLHCSYSFLLTINVWPPFVAFGVFFSSMSAALSCLIGASRILFQLAQDEIFGILLRPVQYTTKNGNPIVAVVISWILVQATLLIGGVSKIAPIVTIFFLFSYAAIDLSCLALDWASAPNFRPTFKYFTWHTSLMGLLSCVIMMFLIQPMYTSFSFLMLLILIAAIHYRSPNSAWGYISQALIFHQVRKYMLMLDVRKEHVKFWRPQILLMVKNPRSSCQLIDFINAIKKSGLYVLGHVSVGHLSDMKDDILGSHQHHWLNFVDNIGVKAFVELTLSPNVRNGTEHLLRLSGLGGMKPNTLVLGFHDDEPQRDTFQMMKIFKKKSINKSHTNSSSSVANLSNMLPQQLANSMETLPPSEEITSSFFSINNNDVSTTAASASSSSYQQGASSSSSSAAVAAASVPRHNQIKCDEYVDIIHDAIKMRKNVCLARYFDQMDKEQMTRGKPNYINVWPVDLLKPLLASGYSNSSSSDADERATSSFKFDTNCIFMLQMACILNMSQKWKRLTKLRIFLVDLGDEKQQQNNPKLHDIQNFLRRMRIKAEIKLIQFTESRHLVADNNIIMTSQQRASYLQAANELVRSQLDQTSVTFVYLPIPSSPVTSSHDYMSCLTSLTNNCGPTLFVHGLNDVISF